jgi:formate C-acetyltransferase
MTRIEFLREQTLSGANKCRRTPLPEMSVAREPYSLPERKALALKKIFDMSPVYIGPEELIVGTRTLFPPNAGNEDGHDVFEYGLYTRIPYVNEADIERFGCDQSYFNRTHYTPDFSIILEKGIGGIISDAEKRKTDPTLMEFQIDFLSSVVIAYRGLENLILRYADEAEARAAEVEGDRRQELWEIARVCRKISTEPPATFHEAVQLLWFAHLGTIMESFEFINYGRLDVILGKYLGDTPREEAAQLIECLLLKMYDQVDLVTTYLGKYAAQLVVTLGGVLPDGENAVNGVTMLFLDAIDKIRLPEPEFNLRLHSKNPPEFLDRAAELTVSGCNFISYYNDDLFVESLTRAGIPQKDARSYGFDLCQDMNIPGKGDFWLVNSIGLSHTLMGVLSKNCRYETFDELVAAMKEDIADAIRNSVEWYNEAEEQLSLYASGDLDAYFDGIKNHGKPVDRRRNSPMAPLPLLSALFHGSLEKALDVAFEPYPILAKGIFIGGCVEAINSLAAIRRIVYEQKRYSLDAVYAACKNNFEGDGEELLRRMLWNCPKWGNDDDAVDDIAVDILEYSLRECEKYKTFLGGQVLGGIHQPHPILNGNGLMATPEGRKSGVAVAVTLSPESGTMKNGPTAALSSAAKIDPMLVQWNFCVMVNYFSSVFRGNDGKETFKQLLQGYFRAGGMQHQPNVLDVATLKKAQLEPEKYKDLIVRLWGVSAHFVDLPRELQDEMIARFTA